MLSANITEFINHLPVYFDRFKPGEELALTSRGNIVAHIKNCVIASLQPLPCTMLYCLLPLIII